MRARVHARECIKHSKTIKPMQHTFHPLWPPPPPKPSSLTRERIRSDGGPADSPVQQQDGILPGSSGVGAVEVSSLVVAHRLQQGPQLGVVLS